MMEILCFLLQDTVAGTFKELQRSRLELECSKSEGMATQLKLISKEKEFSEERELARHAKRFLETQVELEKKLKVSP